MGGIGSGRRRSNYSNKIEDCFSVDVNYLNRNGLLSAGSSSSLRWSRSGRDVGAVRFYMRSVHELVLEYKQISSVDGLWEDSEQVVAIERVPAGGAYGGNRPYFRCSGWGGDEKCGRRVAKLYSEGQDYLCRHCRRLTYQCQYERSWERAGRRARKLREQLGGGNEVFQLRPKGMWYRTYARLIDEVIRLEYKENKGFLDELHHTVPGIDR